MHSHLRLLVHKILLFIRLDCNHVFGLFVHSAPNNSEGTLANLELKLEFSHLKRLLFWVLRTSAIDKASEVS